MDATDFRFPELNLVLYFFNPFGAATMQRILEKLDASIERHPREILLLTLFPEFETLIAGTRYLRLYRRLHRCHIYRITNPAVRDEKKRPGLSPGLSTSQSNRLTPSAWLPIYRPSK